MSEGCKSCCLSLIILCFSTIVLVGVAVYVGANWNSPTPADTSGLIKTTCTVVTATPKEVNCCIDPCGCGVNYECAIQVTYTANNSQIVDANICDFYPTCCTVSEFTCSNCSTSLQPNPDNNSTCHPIVKGNFDYCLVDANTSLPCWYYPEQPDNVYVDLDAGPSTMNSFFTWFGIVLVAVVFLSWPIILGVVCLFKYRQMNQVIEEQENRLPLLAAERREERKKPRIPVPDVEDEECESDEDEEEQAIEEETTEKEDKLVVGIAENGHDHDHNDSSSDESSNSGSSGSISKVNSSSRKKKYRAGLTCKVCMQRKVKLLASPCNHLIYCKSCAMVIASESRPKCAMCRTPIKSFQTVFLN